MKKTVGKSGVRVIKQTHDEWHAFLTESAQADGNKSTRTRKKMNTMKMCYRILFSSGKKINIKKKLQSIFSLFFRCEHEHFDARDIMIFKLSDKFNVIFYNKKFSSNCEDRINFVQCGWMCLMPLRLHCHLDSAFAWNFAQGMKNGTTTLPPSESAALFAIGSPLNVFDFVDMLWSLGIGKRDISRSPIRFAAGFGGAVMANYDRQSHRSQHVRISSCRLDCQLQFRDRGQRALHRARRWSSSFGVCGGAARCGSSSESNRSGRRAGAGRRGRPWGWLTGSRRGTGHACMPAAWPVAAGRSIACCWSRPGSQPSRAACPGPWSARLSPSRVPGARGDSSSRAVWKWKCGIGIHTTDARTDELMGSSVE